MELSALQTSIIGLIGTVASLAVGFGAFSATTEQVVVSAAGTLVSIGFSLWTELHRKTKVQAAIGAGNQAALKRLAG